MHYNTACSLRGIVGEVNFTTSYSDGGQNSIVIIMPCYRLVGPGFKMQWVQKFSPYLSRPAMGPNHPSLQWVLDFCTWGKLARKWHWPSTPSSAKSECGYSCASKFSLCQHCHDICFYILECWAQVQVTGTLEITTKFTKSCTPCMWLINVSCAYPFNKQCLYYNAALLI